ncbi:hypothetical protein [Azospirillum argentinense]|uniref:hypothetical protein n=1 Tax=Azospirillum argentinense TaxID=2970906 RepID=UPI0032E02F2A
MQQHQIPAFHKLVSVVADMLEVDASVFSDKLSEAVFERAVTLYGDLDARARELMRDAGCDELPWDFAHRALEQRQKERVALARIRKIAGQF